MKILKLTKPKRSRKPISIPKEICMWHVDSIFPHIITKSDNPSDFMDIHTAFKHRRQISSLYENAHFAANEFQRWRDMVLERELNTLKPKNK